MAAQLWVTGSSHIFIKRPFGEAKYLGTGRQAPSIEFSPEWEPVINDLAGKVPLDFVYAGEKARLSLELNRFDMAVLLDIQARAKSNTFPTATAGVDQPGMRGTLALIEGSAYQLWVTQLKANQPIFIGMPKVFHFGAAIMSPETWQGGSTQELRLRLSWDVYATFNPLATNEFGFGSFTLWDTDMTGIQGIPIS